ncbi:MAG TPA: glycosyltransferase family 4 protein [Candidatus Polarisedimenticolaceae bacterium]|nr:glycosyltransferase family 4 protein [Candidatus Polarisedimenticolaceae bacterium]
MPPKLYGGTERVVSWLTEELVQRGHEVTLFASGDSQTKAKLVPCCSQALWGDPNVKDWLAYQVRMMEVIFADVSRFDVIHFHGDHMHYPLLRRNPCPNVTTLHGQLLPYDLKPLFDEFAEMPLVSISDAQRKPVPHANWQATVYHGLPPDLHHYCDQPEDYLAFLGRISPEKGLDDAIEIARRAGMKLKIAARIDPVDREYYETKIAPLMAAAGSLVEYVGEIGGQDKDEFLGRARALIFPIAWPEPFGLVMIEAMACGTPVIAYPNGSVPEVLEDGVTGFIVDDVPAAVEAVGRVGELSRQVCRQTFDRRFQLGRMVNDYLRVYGRLIHCSAGARRLSFKARRPRALPAPRPRSRNKVTFGG